MPTSRGLLLRPHRAAGSAQPTKGPVTTDRGGSHHGHGSQANRYFSPRHVQMEWKYATKLVAETGAGCDFCHTAPYGPLEWQNLAHGQAYGGSGCSRTRYAGACSSESPAAGPRSGRGLSPEPAEASPNHCDIGSARSSPGHSDSEGGVPNSVSRNSMRPRLRRNLTVLTETPVAPAICW